jgi:pimeloyl-ACP methyl ester carboxylesterase
VCQSRPAIGTSIRTIGVTEPKKDTPRPTTQRDEPVNTSPLETQPTEQPFLPAKSLARCGRLAAARAADNEFVPTVSVNDIRMYYEVHGSGEPFALILGLGSDISHFEHLVTSLAERYEVLAFDLRGAGRTDKPDAVYSIELMADDTAKLMEVLDFPRANVIGISMGGRVALQLTLQHRERVRKLIVVSASARRPKGLMHTLKWRVLELVARLPLPGGRYAQPYYAHMRQQQASSQCDGTSRLHEIQVPTLILHGKKDRIVPYELAHELHNRIEGSKLVTFNGGHVFFVMKHDRRRFLDAIAEFLS